MSTERRALVLGGTGFLGRRIAAAFEAAGIETVRVARNASGDGSSVTLDLAAAEPARLDRLLADTRPDIVVNAAGIAWQSDEDGMRRINADFTARLADAVARCAHGPLLIQLGTVHEYGPAPEGTSTAEDHETAPITAYGRTKLLGSQAVLKAVREDGLRAAVLRIVNVCGPATPPTSLLGLVSAHVARHTRDAEVPAPLEVTPLVARRDYVDVRDVADAVLAVADAGEQAVGRVFNIGRGEAVPVRDLVERLVAFGGVPDAVRERPAEQGAGVGGAEWQQVDISRARDVLGWQPRHSLEDSLRDQLGGDVTTAVSPVARAVARQTGMRVLFVPFPGVSHIHPIVPLAWAMQGAGHQVRVAVHPGMTDTVGAAGLTTVPVGVTEQLTRVIEFATNPDMLNVLNSQLSLDVGEDNGDGELWARKWAETLSRLHVSRGALEDLVAFCESWRPDLVIWDPFSVAAPVAAKTSGAAHARLLWGRDNIAWLRAKSRERLAARPTEADPVTDLMAPMLEKFGYAFEEELLLGQWTIDPTLPGLRLPLDVDQVPVRRVPYNGTSALPDWLREPVRAPRVCLTLGVGGRGQQLFQESGVTLPELFDAVADLDIELVTTLDAERYASEKPIPANVRMTDYVPLDLLLPSCSAVVHHGGGGTFAAAVAHAVPQLVVPMEFWGEKAIAGHLAERGAGLVVDSVEFGPQRLREGIVRLLEEPSFLQGAVELRDEAAAVPSPGDIVPVLEELTARHRK
ncbi:activator-dependent family glycosyltransferase [Streptomyces sp. NPDC050439]|uniref:activator-dependent family glycosyltransferase n=1 Tax=unclassified Streptomyces TaxID=2593676 RepID=UPI0034178A17